MRSSRLILAVVAASFLHVPASLAQEKELSLKQVLERPMSLMPRPISGLRWLPDGKHFSYLDGRDLVVEDAATGQKRAVVDGDGMKRAIQAAKAKGISPRHLAAATWRDEKSLRLDTGSRLYTLHLEGPRLEKVFEIPAGPEARVYRNDDRAAAYVMDHDVFVKIGDEVTRITHNGFRWLTHGVAVSRVEFGITDGLWWSPDNKKIAFYEEDLRPIAAHAMVDWTTKPEPAKAKSDRYPMAGRPGSIVRIGVFDFDSKKTTWLDIDERKDEYLTNVTFDPSGKRLFVAHVARSQDRMDLRVYDASTGKELALLFTETDNEWVEPESGPIFMPKNDGSFLWFSPRNGYRHLYLYDSSGHLMQQVTTGRFDISSFDGFDGSGEGLYCTGSGENPLERHAFHVSVAEPTAKVENAGATVKLTHAPMRKITEGRGHHRIIRQPGSNGFLDMTSHLGMPPAVRLYEKPGQKTRDVHQSEDPMAAFKMPTRKFFTAKSDDGSDLHGCVLLPPDMDAGKKYPVLCYVYGGPHSQLVSDQWLSGQSARYLWLFWLASRGVVVYWLDGHGTLNRGIDWVQSIHRQMGTLEVADQVAGLKKVQSMANTDPSRVGVFGWSYGGFMTLSLMTRAADHFTAGVAGAPVSDWSYYETGYGERYMDTPAENGDGYKTADPGSHVADLKGRLLIVHGTGDVTVVQQHSVSFLQKAIAAGVDVEYMIYPGQLHGLQAKNRIHFFKKMTRFFDRELGLGDGK